MTQDSKNRVRKDASEACAIYLRKYGIPDATAQASEKFTSGPAVSYTFQGGPNLVYVQESALNEPVLISDQEVSEVLWGSLGKGAWVFFAAVRVLSNEVAAELKLEVHHQVGELNFHVESVHVMEATAMKYRIMRKEGLTTQPGMHMNQDRLPYVVSKPKALSPEEKESTIKLLRELEKVLITRLTIKDFMKLCHNDVKLFSDRRTDEEFVGKSKVSASSQRRF